MPIIVGPNICSVSFIPVCLGYWWPLLLFSFRAAVGDGIILDALKAHF